MTLEIVLKSDRNRPELESLLARELRDGRLPDSIQKLSYNPWQNGETPRVMLIVPPYTRIRRPLDLVLQNLEMDENDSAHLGQDRNIVSALRVAGIDYLEEMKRAGVPMGLLRVGTAAKKAGYDVRILDAVFEGWNNEEHYFTTKEGSEMYSYGLSKEEIAKRIQRFNPHVVGITIDYTHQWGNAREIADLVKILDEKTIVVMGGTHVGHRDYALPGDALLDSPTDYIVLQQTDHSFTELLDVLTGRKEIDVSRVNGVAFRRDGKIVYTDRRPFMSTINDIAIPDLSLVNLDLYSGPNHSAGQRKLDYGKLLYMFTSIGCNIRCSFCAIPNIQGGWVPVEEQTLDSMLGTITKQGVREVLIEDDHLFHDPEWTIKVSQKLQEYNLPWVEEGGVAAFTLVALLPEVSEDFIMSSVAANERHKFNKIIVAKRKGITTGDLISKMAESGCYSLYLAVESANDTSLYTSHKPTLNTKEAYTKKIIEMLAKSGIRTTCGLMLGFINPNGELYVEPRERIENTIRYGQFLKRAGAAYINPFIFTPLPGAEHFPQLKNYAIRNTDEGFSHEFGTIDAPNGEWTRDGLNLLRVHAITQTIGIDGYKQILRTGTWPVRR